MEQKKKKRWLCMFFSIIVIAVSVPSCETYSEKKDKQIEAQIEECIENENYSKAKQLAATMKYGSRMEFKICKAQVSSLVGKGEYDLAGDIAREDADYGVYVNIVLDRLVSIYNSDKQNLNYVLSTLSLPEIDCIYWNGDHHCFKKYDLNTFITSYNEALTSIMEFAKVNNDLQTIKHVASFLKPSYSRKEKWVKDDSYVNEGYWDVKYSDSPNDYSEVKKIKQRFGI